MYIDIEGQYQIKNSKNLTKDAHCYLTSCQLSLASMKRMKSYYLNLKFEVFSHSRISFPFIINAESSYSNGMFSSLYVFPNCSVFTYT